MKWVIYGTGGVGGFFGAKLSTHGEETWCLARGEHLTAMQQHGLIVNSTEGRMTVPSSRCTDDPATAGAADVVLVCVKSYDTREAAKHMHPLLSPATVVISLQNGVDNEETLRALLPGARVFGGVAYIYSTITAPGVVTETGGPKKLIFGPPGQSDTDTVRGREILDVLTRAGINAEMSGDITTVLWSKLVFIASVGGLTALTRLTLGEILASAESRALLEEAMQEAAGVARASGAALDPSFVASTLQTLHKYDNNTRSSLHYDLVHGKRLEIEALSGSVVRYGAQNGTPTPVHRFIFASLLPWHRKAMALR